MPKAKHLPRNDPPRPTPIATVEAKPLPVEPQPEAIQKITAKIEELQPTVAVHDDRIKALEAQIETMKQEWVPQEIITPILDGINDRFKNTVENRIEQLPVTDDVLDRLKRAEADSNKITPAIGQLAELAKQVLEIGTDVKGLETQVNALLTARQLFAEAIDEIKDTLKEVRVEIVQQSEAA